MNTTKVISPPMKSWTWHAIYEDIPEVAIHSNWATLSEGYRELFKENFIAGYNAQYPDMDDPTHRAGYFHRQNRRSLPEED